MHLPLNPECARQSRYCLKCELLKKIDYDEVSSIEEVLVLWERPFAVDDRIGGMCEPRIAECQTILFSRAARVVECQLILFSRAVFFADLVAFSLELDAPS